MADRKAKVDGIPGGMAVDEKGNVWVPAKGIAVYAPDGKKLHTIETSDVIAACAFGEADLKTLFLATRAIVIRARPESQ